MFSLLFFAVGAVPFRQRRMGGMPKKKGGSPESPDGPSLTGPEPECDDAYLVSKGFVMKSVGELIAEHESEYKGSYPIESGYFAHLEGVVMVAQCDDGYTFATSDSCRDPIDYVIPHCSDGSWTIDDYDEHQCVPQTGCDPAGYPKCNNGGTCIPVGESGHRCDCVNGYQGPSCLADTFQDLWQKDMCVGEYSPYMADLCDVLSPQMPCSWGIGHAEFGESYSMYGLSEYNLALQSTFTCINPVDSYACENAHDGLYEIDNVAMADGFHFEWEVPQTIHTIALSLHSEGCEGEYPNSASGFYSVEVKQQGSISWRPVSGLIVDDYHGSGRQMYSLYTPALGVTELRVHVPLASKGNPHLLPGMVELEVYGKTDSYRMLKNPETIVLDNYDHVVLDESSSQCGSCWAFSAPETYPSTHFGSLVEYMAEVESIECIEMDEYSKAESCEVLTDYMYGHKGSVIAPEIHMKYAAETKLNTFWISRDGTGAYTDHAGTPESPRTVTLMFRNSYSDSWLSAGHFLQTHSQVQMYQINPAIHAMEMKWVFDGVSAVDEIHAGYVNDAIVC